MILCCGEALIDFLPRKGADGAAVFQPFAGGSPFNVAIALGRLGAPVGFFGGLSTDFFGATLKDALAASGVDTRLAHVSGKPTTLAFVTLIDGVARYAFFDEETVGRTITGNDLPALPAEISAMTFGSFSLAAEPCGSAFEDLMRREHKSRVILLDPNVRPSLIHNRDAYIQRIDRLVAMADIVKLSAEDLDWLAPDADFADFAADWLEKGAKLVILTKGGDGAEAVSRTTSVALPAVAAEVADTVGAGDTFTAAVLARLETQGFLGKTAIGKLDDTALRDVLAYASQAAAVTVSRPGANPPWLREMPA